MGVGVHSRRIVSGPSQRHVLACEGLGSLQTWLVEERVRDLEAALVRATIVPRPPYGVSEALG